MQTVSNSVTGQFVSFINTKRMEEKAAFNHALELASRLEKLKSTGAFKEVEISSYVADVLQAGQLSVTAR